MNNLEIVIAALISAAQGDKAYAVTPNTIRMVREALPTGCQGYTITAVENIDRLKAVIAQCTNQKNQKYFGLKVIPSNDPRYDDTILVYLTKTMTQKWKNGEEEIPGTLSPYLSNSDTDTDGLAG